MIIRIKVSGRWHVSSKIDELHKAAYCACDDSRDLAYRGLCPVGGILIKQTSLESTMIDLLVRPDDSLSFMRLAVSTRLVEKTLSTTRLVRATSDDLLGDSPSCRVA